MRTQTKQGKNWVYEYNLITDPNWSPTLDAVAEIRPRIQDEIAEYDFEYVSHIHNIGQGWQYTCEKRFGGGEGDGDVHWIVFSISKDDVKKFFKIDGWYASYDGSYLDGDMYEVKEEPVMVMEWKKN